ncbi:SDR family oxidoreductase [Defluviimonas salinarum]|uniref:DUF4166 domain-containing protein n=1 Tax=Defluviimonas salinarum TaxID=2992147 RepID=A0ABT3J2D6_9RHOB|nr:SDR family oxidoreductase [Defluviimonas salinarum]MCW3781850.1 DUF4166 domain-containing protein [Defluviimonas salinarum]
MTRPVLVIGGTGVFGSRLCIALLREPQVEVIVAGRDRAAAERFAARHGGRAERLDRDAPDLEARIAALRPVAVIDAAGPFQAYGADPYRLARAAVAAGAHYLDLSDDAAFTAGIGALDVPARAAGVQVLSGVSSVPALSSAVVEHLCRGIDDLHLIDIAILPGNRAPRGVSVVRAILAQAGQRIRLWRGSRWTEGRGWDQPVGIALFAGERARWASLIGAPDLLLFPERFRARSVVFRAGLELRLMHGGLWFLSLPVRAGLVRNLVPLGAALRWIAARLEPFGSDRGGMQVVVAGIMPGGDAVQREWRLRAGAGDGPQVPTLPARIVLQQLLGGGARPGARPCLAEFGVPAFAAELARSSIDITLEEEGARFPLLFAEALGGSLAALPEPIRALHRVIDLRRWAGRAEVVRGQGRLARLIGWAMGFPPATQDCAVSVEMQRRGAGEVWTRSFAGRRFRSHLTPAGGQGRGIVERFGPLSFHIGLTAHAGWLAYPVLSGRILGLPLPRLLLPVSETLEGVDAQGRATFDVALSHPLSGPIVRYRGWLVPDDDPLSL